MKLDLWTLTLQAINFAVLVLLLRRFLYRPVIRAIDARKAQTEQAMNEATAAKSGAEHARAELAAERAELHGSRDKLLADGRAELAAERERELEAARREADAVHAAARQKLADEALEVRAEVRHHAVDLALELSSAILRGSASPAVAEALVEQATDRLAELPAAELERLRAQIASGSILEIVTAPALPASAEAHVRARLAERFGTAAHIEFASDDQLIAGAELRLPSTVITLSWRDALERARKELERDVAA